MTTTPSLDATDLRFGPPILRPTSLRDFYAFERHVGTMWSRRGSEIPEAWYRLPIFYFSNVSEIRGPDDPVWAPRGSVELDYELEIAALIDTPVRDISAERGEEAIGGYMVMNDWSARDLQREETTVRLGPAKGKDFATSLGPWLVTPDELADARSAKGYDLTGTAEVNGQELSRGNGARSRSTSARWSSAPRPTSAWSPATCSARARWAAAACSRFATNRASGATSSRVIGSRCRWSAWASRYAGDRAATSPVAPALTWRRRLLLSNVGVGDVADRHA